MRLADWTQVFSNRVLVQPGGIGDAPVSCPAGSRPFGGGYLTDTLAMAAVESSPATFSAWDVVVRSADPNPHQFYAALVCSTS
ncbi:hypothetical protein [Pseudonocardia sp. TRM90224]|uniref:hypothetical protein n=1 Tax=Pseudonocardia sp. TRM90224 TaxID=2812678 RepID=UPI001E60962A|nr:hypothetical protein [Pseudonocardia sp. TRM90224]